MCIIILLNSYSFQKQLIGNWKLTSNINNHNEIYRGRNGYITIQFTDAAKTKLEWKLSEGEVIIDKDCFLLRTNLAGTFTEKYYFNQTIIIKPQQ